MDWNKAFNWVIGYVLRWTIGAAVFGVGLELVLGAAHNTFRPQVPLMLTLLVFSLALMGGITSLYMVWLLQKYQTTNLER